MSKHATEILVTCCGWPAEIDVEMVRVCRATWARGIHTQWCCQGDPGAAELAFADITEADRFAQCVFDLDRAWRTGTEPPGIAAWEWQMPLLRMPLTQRWSPILLIPRGALDELAEWLETSRCKPKRYPAAKVIRVAPDAGTVMSREAFEAFEAADLETADD